jgi:hypothetical protein
MAMRNVDNLLHDDTQAKLDAMNGGKDSHDIIDKSDREVDQEVTEIESKVEEKEEIKEEIAEKVQKDEEESSNEEISARHDPYGNELPEERTYTQNEVNEMIRDRLSRGRFAQEQQPQYTPQQQQVVQQAAKDFQVDQDSSEDWESQLASFIDNRINERETKAHNRASQEREAQVQAEFEHKFTTGMSRYQDFAQVTRDKPITDAMMYAARAMDDPAAFIYAASKNHGKELQRISQLQDPYAQATEIGKLEATMRKTKATPAAQKPLSQTKGDYAAGKKQEVKRSIDQLINAHAKTKFRR